MILVPWFVKTTLSPAYELQQKINEIAPLKQSILEARTQSFGNLILPELNKTSDDVLTIFQLHLQILQEKSAPVTCMHGEK